MSIRPVKHESVAVHAREGAGDQGIRFLLVSGKPIEEPAAWHGPIVMNSRKELMKAFEELRTGKFIKEGAVFA